MKLTLCVACGSTDDLQHHHLVTRAEGGSDDESNLITLCCGCAAKKAQGIMLGGRIENRAATTFYKSRSAVAAPAPPDVSRR
jgi:5-methylcytosine-specific restriction endonuclease McrA